MTEKERIEKTYRKIRTKYPDVTNREDLEALAIKADQKLTILQAFGWLLGGMVSCFVMIALWDSDMESLRLIFMMMTGSGLFEFFRTLGKYSCIEKRYRPVAEQRSEGQITKDLIAKRGGRELKKAEGRFILVKSSLVDKNDELETGTDNETHHSYSLRFEHNRCFDFKVKRNVYLDAVLGVEYILALTTDADGNALDIADAFQASNWIMAEELREFYQGEDFDQLNAAARSVAQETEKRKSKKTMSIVAIVLSAVSMLVPVLVAIPMNLVAAVMATITFTKNRSKLSTASVIVSMICLALSVFLLVMVLA